MRLRELVVSYRTAPNAPPGPRPQIATSEDAARIVIPFLTLRPVEHFGVLSLDTKHRVIGWDVVSIGTLDATIVHPRDVFRAAILQNAAAIVLAHNHPSGDTTPSPDDLTLTKRMATVGDLMGINVLDHIIVGEGGQFFAFTTLAAWRG